jgi:putative transposase
LDVKNRFTEEQTIGFLREADRGVGVKELEAENARLKKLLAEKMLENEVTKEALRKKW